MKSPTVDNRSSHFGRSLPERPKPMMAMVEITNRCNMACPVCFSDAHASGDDVTVESVRRYLWNLLEVTETPIPIQISGGEPTLHPHLPKIVAVAREMGFEHIELITNGLKIARHPGMLPGLKRLGLKAVYLQFDGFNPVNLTAIRGSDVSDIRQRALGAVREAGLCCTLAVAVTRGVNDGEIGDIVRFGMENLDVVRAINFQAATPFGGRFDIDGAREAYNLKELVGLIENQTGLPSGTFLSEHIGHRHCNAMSMVFVVDGKWIPLFKYIRPDDLKAFLGEDAREIILAAFSGKKDFYFRHLANPKAWKLLSKATAIFGRNPMNILASRHLLLFTKGFMDRELLDEERVNQCCYAITGEKGVLSFCAYNNLYRSGN